MTQPEIVDRFSAAGGTFVTPADELNGKLDKCRAVVFDWDGVFNAGVKGHGSSSGFSEADSMGTNMLRYGLWRRLGQLPYAAIISGEDNESAIGFAEREHLNAVYSGIRRKQDVIAHLCEQNDLRSDQVACIFDDINDLAMAGICGLRFMIRRNASPMFSDFVTEERLCDYVTGANGGSHAVREICELLLALMGSYREVIESRVACDTEYERYFDARQAVRTAAYIQRDDVIRRS